MAPVAVALRNGAARQRRLNPPTYRRPALWQAGAIGASLSAGGCCRSAIAAAGARGGLQERRPS